jgi:hypothetical protein
VAPFRLLALGDPQLEGDTSLPTDVKRRFKGFARLRQNVSDRRWHVALAEARAALQDFQAETSRTFQYFRKNLDLLGNDYYLAHIYRTLHWATAPTHVTVLGDLLGSQWIDDEEFEDRAIRFSQRVFQGAEIVPRERLQDYTNETNKEAVVETLGQDSSWKRRILNVAGNHDIGYAGDINRKRIERFERAFGPVNGDIRFSLPVRHCASNLSSEGAPTLRLVLLNSMNLDSPAVDQDLQSETFEFVNSIIEHSEPVEAHSTSTILLTHIPLHKEAGICVDEPFFSYFPDYQGGGVEEQNMLSKDISIGATLQGIFGKSPDAEHAPARGLGRDGIILTGHDHEGCDSYHYVDHEKQEWTASKYKSEQASKARQNQSVPGLREVTVRSMMGEFGGNAALVSAWWDEQQGKWQIELEMCSLGVQHIWWAIHVVDIVALIISIVAIITSLVGGEARPAKNKPVSQRNSVSKGPSRPAPTPKRDIKSQSPYTKKASAFSRKMQQSLDEGRAERDSDSNTNHQKAPGSQKKKRGVKPK